RQVSPRLGPEPPGRRSARQIRHDRHAKRLRRDDEHEVHAVCREEAVRPLAAPELLREHGADGGCRRAHDREREAGDEAAPQGAAAAFSHAPATATAAEAHRRVQPRLYIQCNPRSRSSVSLRTMPADDATWTPSFIEELQQEFGDLYTGRTCVVTGADGFMGSHLTEALVHLGANVVAFVRATSSGALNNIGHLRPHLRVV